VSDSADDFAQMWSWFATHCEGYSPLYERICTAVAADPEVLAFVKSAPPEAHLPPALLAAVHFELLGDPDHELACVYRGESDADPAPLFLALCRERSDAVMEVLSTHYIQTNECGRSAAIAPGLTWVARQLGDAPLALVDVGASAGLNLLCDRFRLDYGPHGTTGPLQSPVIVRCEVRGGNPPIAQRLPEFVERVGIDRSPVDVTDPADARWLLACVWPDTGRLERTAAAIHLAQELRPRVLRGDANEAISPVVESLPAGTAVLLVTTWAFAYLPVEDRARFIEQLVALSSSRPIAWVSAESPGTVKPLDPLVAGVGDSETPDVLGAVLFSAGETRAAVLGDVQEHGGWIDWRAPDRFA
jgi:hypothetical protein